MVPLWSATRGGVVKALRNIRLSTWSPSLTPLPEAWIRTVSTSSRIRTTENVVTSPFPDIPQPTGNLVDSIFKNANQWGSNTALECSETGRSYTYNQILEGMAKWAGFLTSLGMTKGDIIAVNMPNCPEYPIVLLGAISIGVVVTTVNHNYTADELARQLKDSRAQLIVGMPSLEDTIMSSINLLKHPLRLVTNGSSKVPGALNLHDILKDPSIPYADTIHVENRDLAVMPYSSGTTGPPKGTTVSHGALSLCIGMLTDPAFFTTRFATDSYQSSYLSLLPFYHAYGLFVLMMVGLHAGVKLVPLPVFDPELYVKAIEKYKVEVLQLVPLLMNFLVASPAVTPKALSSVRSVLVGAAPVSPSAAEAFKMKFGRDIFLQEGYGMTEVLVTNMTPIGKERIGMCGQLLPNVSAKIIDTSTGEDLAPTQTGEICLKTSTMMNGYFQNEAATAATVDSDGWLHSGDVGFFDDDGYLKIVDRTKELIKVKGLQVSPSELEDVIRQHPQVVDVGVVGVPHDRQGEAPRAYVIIREEITADDIHRFLEKKVAPHKKLVGGVAFVKELPKTGTGKLLRRELNNM